MVGVGGAVGGMVGSAVGNAMNQAMPGGANFTQNNTVTCSCGAILPASAKFCFSCGNPIAVAPAEETIICPGCGKTVAKGKFCLECGQKL
ncbi:MAG: zinc ribbon domain-containing protein, partial [Clostridia bacterium]|nr:zinc ribbon domain-containing protein [Clostridia bacterium]